MDRPSSGLRLAATLLICLSGASAGAATTDSVWKEGVHYEVLNLPETVPAPVGKVEVIEFFWYGCPHCYDLEPALERWQRASPADVAFVRVPAGYRPESLAHARLYYALVAVGREDLHQAVFRTIHHDGNRLFVKDDEQRTVDLQRAFAVAHGIDGEKFVRALQSNPVALQVDRAVQMAKRFRLTGVPAIVIDGIYKTDLGAAGDAERLVTLIDDLAERERTRKAASLRPASRR